MKIYQTFKTSKTHHLEESIQTRWNETAERFLEDVDESDFRLVAIKEFLKPEKNKLYLEVGCGKGRFMRKFTGRTIGIDISEEMLKTAKKNNQIVILASATSLPFRDNIFDGVFAIEVMEHIPNTRKSIGELARIIKRDGKIIIVDRNKLSISDEIKENIFCRRLKLPIPVYLHHKYHEWRNHHLYKRDFVFKEKWFYPWELSKLLKKYCRWNDIEYATKNKYYTKIFPFVSHFIFWKGIK